MDLLCSHLHFAFLLKSAGLPNLEWLQVLMLCIFISQAFKVSHCCPGSTAFSRPQCKWRDGDMYTDVQGQIQRELGGVATPHFWIGVHYRSLWAL